MKRNLPDQVDIAVVGAGTAGCSAAMPACRAGLSVLLIEKTEASEVGTKVCGNGMSAEGLAAVSHYVPLPGGPEIAARVEGGSLYVAGVEGSTFVPVGGLIINRVLFGQRLLSDAVSAGAHLADGVTCVGWSDREEGRVRVRSNGGEESEVKARVVIDASGFRSVLTRTGGPSRADETLRSEVGVGYREVLALREPLSEADGGFIVFGPPGAEHGYAWAFPMGGSLANVGLGRTLDTNGGPLKAAYDAFVRGRPEFAGAEIVSAGAGMLPLRRPLDSLVGDGFMTVGDAACHANPLHGGGIAPSIVAGVMAGEQAVAALGNNDRSAAALWEYAVRYMREIGSIYASHEVMRELVYSLTPGELMFMAAEYTKADSLVRALTGSDLLPSLAAAAQRVFSMARRPGLVTRVIRKTRQMKAVRRHYMDYPEAPEGLDRWVGRARSLRTPASQQPGAAS